jgi:hypothetical protein
MGEISIDIQKLEEYIAEITAMREGWSKKTRPFGIGDEGRTVARMEGLVRLYEGLYASIIETDR